MYLLHSYKSKHHLSHQDNSGLDKSSLNFNAGHNYLHIGLVQWATLSLLLGRVWTHPCFPTPKSISLLPNSYPPQYYPHPFTLIQWISRVNLDKSIQRKMCLGAAPPWPLHAQELAGNRFQRNQHQLPPKLRRHRRHRHTHHCATPLVAGSLPPTPTRPATLTEHEVTLLHVSMDAASQDSICYISLLGGPSCMLDELTSAVQRWPMGGGSMTSPCPRNELLLPAFLFYGKGKEARELHTVWTPSANG
jgi:hypothetical protein